MRSSLSISTSEKTLSLTQEEAFALLEMCTLTLATESPTHLQLIARVGALCREMLAAPPANEQALSDNHARRSSAYRYREPLTIACLF